MREHIDAYTEHNTTSIAITAGQRLCELRAYADQNSITYPLLADEDWRAIKSYGVYDRFGMAAHNLFYNIFRPARFIIDKRGYSFYDWLGLSNHSLADSIARPATFIIDKLGIIRYLYVGLNQFDLAEQEEIIEHLKLLR